MEAFQQCCAGFRHLEDFGDANTPYYHMSPRRRLRSSGAREQVAGCLAGDRLIELSAAVEDRGSAGQIGSVAARVSGGWLGVSYPELK